MKKFGGHKIFSREIVGVKKSRDFWMTTNFNENFVL